MKIHKIRVESFEPYGLNKYKNFLDDNEFETYSEDEIVGWAEGILTDIEMDGNMAIFIHTSNDNMYAITKEYNWKDDVFYISKYIACDDLDFFAMLDADLNFTAYGLVMQLDKTHWSTICF